MATIADCAVLAEDVYDSEDSRPAAGAGWARLNQEEWSGGFAAGRYKRSRPPGELIVAYRGTDDLTDWVHNSLMVPVIEAANAGDAIRSLLTAYDVGDRGLLAMGPDLIEGIFSDVRVRAAIWALADQIPRPQVERALKYFDDTTPRPEIVVGHSLGGALAKIVSQNRDVPAVAFNSPFMGDLGGVVPATSGLQISVNASRDPLSFVTASVGNLAHGESIAVDVRSFPVPRLPDRPTRNHWTPLSAVRDTVTRIRDEARLQLDLIEYVGDAALHYHQMSTLTPVLRGSSEFSQSLDRRFGITR